MSDVSVTVSKGSDGGSKRKLEESGEGDCLKTSHPPVHVNKKRADSVSVLSDNETKSADQETSLKSVEAPMALSKQNQPPLSEVTKQGGPKDDSETSLTGNDSQEQKPSVIKNEYSMTNQNSIAGASPSSSRLTSSEMLSMKKEPSISDSSMLSNHSSIHQLRGNQVGPQQFGNQIGGDPTSLSATSTAGRDRLSARAQNLHMSPFHNPSNMSMSSPPLDTYSMREQLYRAQIKEQNFRREQMYLDEILRLREREQLLLTAGGLMPQQPPTPSSFPPISGNSFGYNSGLLPPSMNQGFPGGSSHTDLLEHERMLLQMQKYRAMTNMSFEQRNPGLLGANSMTSLNDGIVPDHLTGPSSASALMRGDNSSLPAHCHPTSAFNSSSSLNPHMPAFNGGTGRDDINDNLMHYTKRTIVPLGTEDDQIWLSEFLCFLRAECVEVFRASKADVRYRKNSKKIKNNQVGIRCRFCAHLPHQARGSRSSSYPSSISRIYQSFTMMIRDHFSKCNDMPADIRMKYNRLKASTTKGEMESKRYWTESASALGLYDEPGGGILFRDDMNNTQK